MILKEAKLPKTHKIYLISDKHEGTIMKHRAGIERMKEEVMSEPHSYIMDGGDIVEAIMVDDKRYSPDTVDPKSSRPLIQYQEAAKEMWEVRERILVSCLGNHDWQITARVGNMIKDIYCKELDDGKRDTYGTYSCKMSIKDTKGNLMYKVFMTHGNGSIRSTADNPVRRNANMELSLQRKLAPLAGDCLIMTMSHTHLLLVKEPESELYLTDDGLGIHHAYTSAPQVANYIHPDLRWYVNTGSFYKLYADPELGVSGYAEKSMYRPNELGYAVIHVVDGVVKDIEKRTI